jgi:hypothetical protein
MRRLLITAAFCLITSLAQAQMPAALGGAPDSLLMGDQMELRLTFTPPGPGTLLPDWRESLGSFELLAPPDTSALQGYRGGPVVLNLKATCYEPGDQTLGPVTVNWVIPDGQTVSGQTAGFTVHVRGVVPESQLAQADTAQKPHQLLDPNRVKKLGLSLADLLPWIIGVVIAAAVVYALLWYFKKRRRKALEAEAPQEPPRPPHEIAIEALDALRDRRLYQAGRLKEYYTELTDILRHYVEGRFTIPALESTSFQLLRDLEPKVNDANLRLLLENLLSDADLAKFAKNQPDETTCQRDLEKGYVFVQKTTPQAPLLTPKGEAA